MKVTEHLKRAKNTLFSFEILPPLKGKGIEDIYKGIDPLMEFDPPFINVTYHREEYVYKKFPNDMLKKVSIRKRPGTVGICAAIINKYDIDAVPHLICGGFTKEETENALIDLHCLGVDNVLALRGDPIKTENNFVPEENGHHFAEELIGQISELNQGNYLHEESQNSRKTNFCIGAAGYPEKHYESMSIKTDLTYLKRKVEAGAEYITTQLFFDNEKFFEFERKCRAIGIDVPIIPGLKPITSLRHIQFLPKTFFVDFPDELADKLMDCRTNDEVQKVGVEWCIKQSQELLEHKVPCLHFYTMGRSAAVKQIASEIF
ncbi:MAG: methylenetetrahydrofolate reductase [NAD(P)H] [Bacteroidota bacterium]